MNITIVNSHPKYLIGGAELFMYYCAREFKRNGHNVSMISVYPKGMDVGIPSKIETLEGIKIYHLPDAATDISTAVDFLKILNGLKTDVFLKMFTDPSTVLLAGYALLKKVPYVLFMAHDGYCRKDAGTSVGGRYKVNFYTKFLMTTAGLYGWALRRASKMLVQNNLQKELLFENFKIAADDVIKVGHPVPAGMPEKDNPPIMIWSGRFQPWKNPEIFLELARRLPEYAFYIGGPAKDEKETEYCKEIIRKAGELPNVKIYPFPESFEKFLQFPLYAKASLFIDAIESGGFENTIVQAMLRGVPVISFFRDFDGIMKNEKIGVCCNGNMDNLVGAVKFFMSNQAELKEMGDRAKNFAAREYDITPIASRILEHLNDAAGLPGSFTE